MVGGTGKDEICACCDFSDGDFLDSCPNLVGVVGRDRASVF